MTGPPERMRSKLRNLLHKPRETTEDRVFPPQCVQVETHTHTCVQSTVCLIREVCLSPASHSNIYVPTDKTTVVE